MSKRTWGAVLSATALVIVVILVLLYFNRDTGTPPEEQRGTELVETVPAENNPVRAELEVNGTDDTFLEESKETGAEVFQFLLVEQDNYVTVYSLPEREVYEYTDVILDVLPEELREEIRQGKYLKNEEELYNFLENYTS